VLPGALARLRAEHPSVRVRLHEGRTEDLLPLLLVGEIDLIVGRLYEPALPDGLYREALWDEPISVLARTGHPLLGLAEIGAPDLMRYDMILPTISQRVGIEIEQILFELGDGAERPPMRSASYGLIREMLFDSDMIAMLPRLMLVGDLLRGALGWRALPVAPRPRPAGLIYRPLPALAPAAQALVGCLRMHVAEIGRRGVTG
jgi:LysR family pca operon transcriptional activator